MAVGYYAGLAQARSYWVLGGMSPTTWVSSLGMIPLGTIPSESIGWLILRFSILQQARIVYFLATERFADTKLNFWVWKLQKERPLISLYTYFDLTWLPRHDTPWHCGTCSCSIWARGGSTDTSLFKLGRLSKDVGYGSKLSTWMIGWWVPKIDKSIHGFPSVEFLSIAIWWFPDIGLPPNYPF